MTGATGAGLRIAYVIATTAGGTGRHAAMLAAGCAERGLDVTVAGPSSARALFPAQARYLPLEITGRPRPARDAVAVARLARLLGRCEPDIVHAHGLRAAAAAALALARPGHHRAVSAAGTTESAQDRDGRRPAHRPALVVTVHNAPPGGAVGGAVYRVLEWLAARRADTVLCVSPDLADRMRRAGARDVALTVVAAPPPRAPAPAEVASARADIGAPGRPVVLAVARLAPQKGLDVLVAAAARLSGREPAPVLAIAGDGPLAAELATRARSAGVQARFLGQRTDVPALLAAADVVVVPSRWEGQPLIVAEALRAGRPLVASRVAGTTALTGEDAALLVQPGDPAALAAAIESVLDDPAVARRLTAAGSARAATLPASADAVAAATAVYARLTT